MPAKKSRTVDVTADTVITVEASPADNLYFDAQEEKNGLTLVPDDKAPDNQTVDIVLIDGASISRDGLTVCRHK